VGHRIGIVGASGYAGGELIRLVDAHPGLELVFIGAHRRAGESLGSVHPHLSGGERTLERLDALESADIDLVFLALLHGASAEPAHTLAAAGVKVVDLGSDYRMDSPERYFAAYGSDHPYPDELDDWVYGLPELFGDLVRGADRVAAPGCYPTSALLGLGPLLSEGVISPAGIIVDAMSGVSGAGRSPQPGLMFGAVAEGAAAYGVLTHRHRPEIEQGLEMVAASPASVVFTPHLIPMQRGLLATCYADLAPGMGEAEAVGAFAGAYNETPFVSVVDIPPQTRWVVGTNRCLVSVAVDERIGKVVVLSAIDNLVKGAAGQAVQCANLMLGIDETDGLPVDGWMP
jgi:N-acetyl-gamma-glutamyl-phosphate reductase